MDDTPLTNHGATGDVALDELRRIVAINVRTAREALGWSLRQLSDRVGVSKAGLSNLERGDTNPGLETLARVADGLGRSVASLLSPTVDSPHVVRKGGGRRFNFSGPELDYALLFAGEHRRLEIFEITLRSGSHWRWEGHGNPGFREYIYVLEGILQAGPVDDLQELHPGDAMVIFASQEHIYEAVDGPARILSISAY